MKIAKLIAVCLLLTGLLTSCIVHRGAGRRYHVPEPPPGYRGM